MKNIILISAIAFLLFTCSNKDFRWWGAQKEVGPEFWGTIPHIDIISNRIMKLDYNSQKLLFSIGRENGNIDIIDATGIDEKITIQAHKMRISSLVSSNNGELLASSSSTVDETTKIWDPKSGEMLIEIPKTRGPEVFSNDGNVIYIAHNSKLFIYDILNHGFFPIDYSSNGVIQSLAVSSDGKFLAVGTTGKVQIWKIDKKHSGILFWLKLENVSLELVSEKTLYGLKNWIQSVAFTKDNLQLSTISRFGGIDILDAPNLTNRRQHKIKRTQVKTVNYIESEGVFIITAMRAFKGANTRYITTYVKPSPLQDEGNKFSFDNKCNAQFPYVFQSPEMAFTANAEGLLYISQDGKIKKQSKAINPEGCQLPPSSAPDCNKSFTFVKSPKNKVSDDGFTVFYDGQDKVILPILIQKALVKQKLYGCNKRYDTSLSKTKESTLNKSTKSVTQQQINNQKQVPQVLKRKLDARTLKLNVEGESYYSKNKYDAANQVFEKIIHLDNSNVRALNNLAIVSLKMGNKNKAITSSHRVLHSLSASSKEKAAALYNMGLACEGKGPMQIPGERRQGASVDPLWYCLQSSLELYTQSFITFPNKGSSDNILKKFTNAKTAENKCQLTDGQYKTYFRRDNKFIFLNKKQQPDFLNTLTSETSDNTVSLKIKATAKLINGLYISTFWAPSSKAMTLDNESCEFLSK